MSYSASSSLVQFDLSICSFIRKMMMDSRGLYDDVEVGNWFVGLLDKCLVIKFKTLIHRIILYCFYS